MYYILVPRELCVRRRVFLQNPTARDGRVVLTGSDLSRVRFSLGQVEILNDVDMAPLWPDPETENPDMEPEGDDGMSDNLTEGEE